MNSKVIRKYFLDFFVSKLHTIVPSAPLVLKNDPTLMFTNAGMNQFKDYFLGNKIPQTKRIADTQKCLRVSGKHNDLEDVGLDTYHHTMFEMLGNWSFGDYFKEDAIKWAWELLTEVYKLPKDKLYVTVFEGDQNEGLSFDTEAFDIWTKYIDEKHIIKGNKKDNFWEMGEMGPCGPCSEIHIDLRSDQEISKIPGKDKVNNNDPQVIEIWNIVFIQYNRKADGSLENLPEKHVDTGMGFERLVRAIQNKSSNYDTDIFSPLIHFIEKKGGVQYGTDEKTDIAIRVIVDHIRAIAFAIADGQLPSNIKAGYVIRRILRRAIRYGYTFLNFKSPFINELVPILSDQFEDVFPEIHNQRDFIINVIFEEETSFLKTLEQGIKILEFKMSSIADSSKIIDGKTAFELYDTFGFPFDLTYLIAKENGFEVNEKEYEKEMQIQKDRSRNATSIQSSDWNIIDNDIKSSFIGYDSITTSTKIIKYRTIQMQGKDVHQIVLAETPFYAESGGQVGDTGILKVNGDALKVIDTKKEGDLTIHIVDKLPTSINDSVLATIDLEKRLSTENNHSATHLLQAALKRVLGNHVNQKGSLNNQDVLRFDFSHYSPMTDDELKKVEEIVNEKVRENIVRVEQRNVPIGEAQKMGAMALFGEKYGEFVRVITFDKDFSIELCGGTHVKATGNIGYFKIISESSVASGVRRIEALTGLAAEKYISRQLSELSKIGDLLKTNSDIPKSIQSLLSEKASLQKKIEVYEQNAQQEIKKELLKNIINKEGVNIIIEKVSIPSADSLKTMAFELKNQVSNLFGLLASNIEGKPYIAVVISDNLVSEKGLNAVQIVKELAKEIQGGGGGQPFFATAGGKDLEGLDRIIVKANDYISAQFNK